MSNYTENLEKQNEELKERLAKAENVADTLIDTYAAAMIVVNNAIFDEYNMLVDDTIFDILRETLEFDPNNTLFDDQKEKIKEAVEKIQKEVEMRT